MILRNSRTVIEFHIKGYQFPIVDGPLMKWDKNRLIIEGFIRETMPEEHYPDEIKKWSFSDPCLEAPDVERLIAWLENINSNDPGPKKSRINFTEPCMSWYYSHGSLYLKLDLKFETNWNRPQGFYMFSFSEFADQLISDLKQELALFPPR